MSWIYHLDYKYNWKSLINVVCPEVNDNAALLGLMLKQKDIPFDYCVISKTENPHYKGDVELVLLGQENLFNLSKNTRACVIPYTGALMEIGVQQRGSFKCNMVDFVFAEKVRKKWLLYERIYSALNAQMKVCDNSRDPDEYAVLLETSRAVDKLLSHYEKFAKQNFYLLP